MEREEATPSGNGRRLVTTLKPARIVTVAGMRQSGSTLTYNIILNLYRLLGIPVACGYVTRLDELLESGSEHLLIKSHEFDERLHGSPETFVVTVKRDVRDTVASRFRRFARIDRPFERKDAGDALAVAGEQIDIYESLKDRSDYEFVYEAYRADRVRAAMELAGAVFGRVDKRKLKRALHKAEKLHTTKEVPETSQHAADARFDRHLLSQSHITNAGRVDAFRSTLRPDEVAAINGTFGGWLADNQYRL